MSRDRDARTIELASGANVLVGFWLVGSPFLLGFADSDVAAGTAAVAGLAVAMLAAARVMAGFLRPWLSWANLALGAFLAVSPWLLGFTDVDGILWSHVVGGMVVAALGATSALAKPAVDRREIS